jgi:hypothetical protein
VILTGLRGGSSKGDPLLSVARSEQMSRRRELPLFAAPPAVVDLAREKLTRDQCPRRYCWFWHSLGFDWELKPEEGCGVPNEHPRDELLERRGAELEPWRQCCRASGNPQHPDYYEPREPHLKADGWPEDYFLVVGKEARQRRFARRQQGKRREETE